MNFFIKTMVIFTITVQTIKSSDLEDLCISEEKFRNKYQEENSNLMIDLFYQTETKQIGQGNYGIVKTVILNDKEVAVKRIKLNKVDEFDLSSLKEIENVKKFSEFEGFPDFIDCFYSEDKINVFLIMQKLYSDLDFGDKNLFKENRNKKERIFNYLQIFKAVKKMHDLKIAHEDIKRANIMTDTENFDNLFLIDLGLSGKFGEKNRGGSFWTNPPEKNKYTNIQINPDQDIYALGITIAFIERKNEEIFDEVTNKILLENYYDFNYEIIKDNILKVINRSFFIHPEEISFFKKIWKWFLSLFIKEDKYHCKESKKVVCIVRDMIAFNPKDRPSINKVIKYFEDIYKIYDEISKYKKKKSKKNTKIETAKSPDLKTESLRDESLNLDNSLDIESQKIKNNKKIKSKINESFNLGESISMVNAEKNRNKNISNKLEDDLKDKMVLDSLDSKIKIIL